MPGTILAWVSVFVLDLAVTRRHPRHVLIVHVDKQRLREVCERCGVASLEVFGSAARNEDRQDSDIDLLYVLKPDARLGFRLLDLEDELADLLGRPVDLVSRKSVNTETFVATAVDDLPHMIQQLGSAISTADDDVDPGSTARTTRHGSPCRPGRPVDTPRPFAPPPAR